MAHRQRALVIGSGPNGLVGANVLADAGFEVSVLEEAPYMGGGVRSSEDTLPGFVHDPCAGFFPLTAASPFFASLELERHGLEWVHPRVPMAHPFLRSEGIALHRDVARTAVELERAARGAGGAWEDLVRPLIERRSLVTDMAFDTFPPLLATVRLVRALRLRSLRLAYLMAGSAEQLGRALFSHPAPTAWLYGSTAHSDLSPHHAGGAAFGFALNWLGHAVGWPFPRGGAGRLSQALVARLREQGGDVRCTCAVQRVLCRSGRTVGVELQGGELLSASVVLASVSVAPLLAMLPVDALPTRLSRRLAQWRYGLGTFKLDWALSGQVPWNDGQARQAAVVHVCDTLEAAARAAREAAQGAVPREPTLIVGQQSLHDPSRAPAGRHTLYAYTRVPSAYREHDDAVADLVERRIEQFAPGFRRLVLARRVRSPAALERENASEVGGDLGGGSMRAEQQLLLRPAPELVRYRTPLRGLYLASASVHPGPGVHGAQGAKAAHAAIADWLGDCGA